MPPVGFEPTIAAGERAKTYTLDRSATGTGPWIIITIINYKGLVSNAVKTILPYFKLSLM